MRRTCLLVGLLLLPSFAGCGSTTRAARSSPSLPTPSCGPSGETFSLVAKDFRFSTDCLAVQAHRPFTIAFDNQDAGVAHNVAIHTGYWMYSVAAPWLFAGEYITGTATTVYHVPGLAPGRYVFMCDVHHDQMTGHFLVVQGGPSG